jgi:hypothetical protein
MQNDLAEIRLYAERKAGELLKETELNKGAATVSSDTTPLPKLKDIGITRDQSSNWQRIADIPEENPLHNDRGLDKPILKGIGIGSGSTNTRAVLGM